MAKKGLDTSKLPSPEEFVELYVTWVKKYHKKWDFYVTTDMRPVAPEVFEWHKLLETKGIRPVPVFHGDVHVDWLKRYVDRGYTYICLGGATTSRSGKRGLAQYLDTLFNFGAKNNVKFHGLAMTSPWIMMTWPWHSVDSSWWSRSAGYGSIMRFSDVTERMSILHISPRESKTAVKDAIFKANKTAMQRLREELKHEGFDLDFLREDFTERHVLNARTMMQMAAAATRRQRGTWNLLF